VPTLDADTLEPLPLLGAQITCFTDTKVPILTQKALVEGVTSTLPLPPLSIRTFVPSTEPVKPAEGVTSTLPLPPDDLPAAAAAGNESWQGKRWLDGVLMDCPSESVRRVYLLYWYKSANTGWAEGAAGCRRVAASLKTC
jgi:hypothetical protein